MRDGLTSTKHDGVGGKSIAILEWQLSVNDDVIKSSADKVSLQPETQAVLLTTCGSEMLNRGLRVLRNVKFMCKRLQIKHSWSIVLHTHAIVTMSYLLKEATI